MTPRERTKNLLRRIDKFLPAFKVKDEIYLEVEAEIEESLDNDWAVRLRYRAPSHQSRQLIDVLIQCIEIAHADTEDDVQQAIVNALRPVLRKDKQE